MLRAWFIGTSLICLAACGGTGESELVFCAETGGSRIKLDRWQEPEGQFERERLWDSALDTYCEPRRYGDAGDYYCVPTESRDAVYFELPDCTQPFVATGSVGEPPPYAWTAAPDGCGGDRLLYRVGASMNGLPTAAYFRDASGACQQVAVPPGAYHETDGSVDSSELVALTEERVGTGQVVLRRFAGADGSILCTQPWDTTFGSSCRVLPDQPGEFRCMPVELSVRELFVDDSCSETAEVVVVDRCPDQMPTVAAQPTRVDCGISALVREVASTSSDTYYDDFAGCEAFGTPGVTRFATLGEVVDPSAMVPFTPRDETGGTRLRRRWMVGPENQAVPSGRWWDSELGVACRVERLNDVIAYCDPIIPSLELRYTDAACTVEVQVAGPASSCDLDPLVLAGNQSDDTYSTLAPRTEATFRLTDEVCVQETGMFFDPVGEISRSTRVRFDRVVD